MPQIKSIKILASRWAVKWGEDWNKPEKERGLTEFEEKTIYINTKYPAWDQYSSLLHEVIHAIEDELDIDLKEKQVRALEIGLIQVLRENPRFVKELCKAPPEELEEEHTDDQRS